MQRPPRCESFFGIYRRLHLNSFENKIRRCHQVRSYPLEIRAAYARGLIHNRPQDRRVEVETLLEEGGIMNYQWLALTAFKSDL
jgi:hypothetical protein